MKSRKCDFFCARESALGYTKNYSSDLSVLGNPFTGKNAVELYEEYIKTAFEMEPLVNAAIRNIIELEEQDGLVSLGCFCRMKDRCHVDVLMEVIEDIKMHILLS